MIYVNFERNRDKSKCMEQKNSEFANKPGKWLVCKLRKRKENDRKYFRNVTLF